MLYKNGINLNSSLLDFINRSNKLSIYVPYIRVPQLKFLLTNSTQIDKVIVRWESSDLVYGSSDLKIYAVLKELNIQLYRNSRLHLKAFVDNHERAFIGSANISQRALNFPETPNYNYELGVVVSDLTMADRLYFQTIEAESTLITDEIYAQLKSQLDQIRIRLPKEPIFNFEFAQIDKNFLISSLPMSYNIETLFEVYENENSNDELKLRCALHDLALYKIPLGLEKPLFMNRLRDSFFNHPFIKAFLKNLELQNEIYFGRAKDWIQKNCSESPTPIKWELTINIQILFRWIVELGNNLYTIDRPNYSERLFKIEKSDKLY